jgi:hypothetical protein
LHPVASHFYKSLKGFERSYDEHSKRRRMNVERKSVPKLTVNQLRASLFGTQV